MSAWLNQLRRALDVSTCPVAFFFRDDDVGWDDERLFALLDVFAQRAAPLDLAVIPESLTVALAGELRNRAESSPGHFAAHQHGFAHLNHETEGRKCEFGPARPQTHQRSDIECGRDRLRDLLGPLIKPIFTPPWNRCAGETGDCLVELGFRILSRDATATPIRIPGLMELPIRVDWFAKRKGVRLSQEGLGELLARKINPDEPCGIMFHHAAMDEDERRATGELLELLATHERAKLMMMHEIGSEKLM
jgi:hypothetical protein